jgi:predicted nucleotidyltransferase
MAKKSKVTPELWAEAKKLCALTDEDLEKAKKLGFTPQTLLRNRRRNRKQRWKLPATDWIRAVWDEKIEHARYTAALIHDRELQEYDFHEDEIASEPLDVPREAALQIAQALSEIDCIERIDVIGSLACERWRPAYDLDLAVWVSDLSGLSGIRRTIADALLREAGHRYSVSPEVVDLFILERFDGHLAECPSAGAAACQVAGCGVQPFLRQFKEFVFDLKRFGQCQRVVLFDRRNGGLVSTPKWPPDSLDYDVPS